MARSKELVDRIVTGFQANQTKENQAKMEAYMKNHFRFYGIKTPQRKEILNPILKEYKNLTEMERWKAAELLYEKDERECQYAALAILEKGVGEASASAISFYKTLLMNKPWWDTVDAIAVNLCGRYFLSHPEKLVPITESWRESDCLWVRRSSLLHQLSYKEQTNEGLLFETVKSRSHEKEFFIEKAIGWALREFSKTALQKVVNFVDTYELRPLSKREALKYMKQKGLIQV